MQQVSVNWRTKMLRGKCVCITGPSSAHALTMARFWAGRERFTEFDLNNGGSAS